MAEDIDIDAIRKQLLDMRDELESLAETGDASAAVVELDQSKVGRLSRMDAMQSQAMAKAAQGRRVETLRNITAALRRIDEDEYGLCKACDEAIDPRRLAFDPTALFCIECAEKKER